jgi:hypothetical protein
VCRCPASVGQSATSSNSTSMPTGLGRARSLVICHDSSMPIGRRSRYAVMPWAVLLMVLGLTASYALFESRSISEGQNAALESTEGHFRDVVKDNENRAQLVSEAYNRVLAGAIYGLKSPVDPALVATRLDILLPDVLPGSEMFFVVPSGGEPVKIRGRQQPSAKMRISDSAPPGLWVGIPNPDQNIVVIGYTTVSGARRCGTPP